MFSSFRRSIRPRLSVVAAARPNFMKVGPVIKALMDVADIELVHTGQHYDRAMSQSFFDELSLPAPDVNLGVGSGSHAAQTAAVMVTYEKHLAPRHPDAVIVVGDVNSTLAATLVATKLRIPVAHVEAGLRAGDWDMPEEINRVLTDRVSRWLLAPSDDAAENLRREGLEPNWIHVVGNVMIDTLFHNLPRARERAARLQEEHGLHRYALVTLHRPSNVDDGDQLSRLLEAVGAVDSDLRILFPVHPRTRRALDVSGRSLANFQLMDPLGYLDFVGLMTGAEVVFTDSGGVQEETSALGVPCVTLRDSTERPVTCMLGTNELAGTTPAAILDAGRRALDRDRTPAKIPLWDGRAGERIAEVLLTDLRG